jgi:GT2 family glycosyltransferase
MMDKSKQLQEPWPKVAILILNWNGWEDTIECIESVLQIDYPNYYAIVIDNGSTNDSITKIKDYADGKIKIKSKYVKYSPKNKPIKLLELTNKNADSSEKDLGDHGKEFFKTKIDQRLILLKNEKNFGFAEGNNIGMRFALTGFDPDYILLLNNDVTVEPDFLTKMIKVGESDKKSGIIGSKIPYYDNPDKNWFCKGIINWFSINIAYHSDKCREEIINSDYITGCVALIKKEVIEKVGYLDKTLFLYFEDADYCLRARNSGYSMVVVPSAIVYHKVSATSYSFIKSTAQYYFSRNRIWFVKKYCPKKHQKFSMMFLFLRLFLALGFFTLKGDGATVKEIMKAYKVGFNGSY